VSALLTMAALALLAARPAVQSVVLEPDARPTLTITASGPLPAPEAERAEGHLTLTWDADLAPGAQAPAPRPPLKALRLLQRDGRLVLEVTLDASVPHRIEAEDTRVRVRFGAAPPAPPDVAALWATLFPPITDPEPLEAPSVEAEGSGASSTEPEDGVLLGPVLLRPALEVLYISATARS
jgi:hypothetical protein